VRQALNVTGKLQLGFRDSTPPIPERHASADSRRNAALAVVLQRWRTTDRVRRC
jgi:hypothetical protein